MDVMETAAKWVWKNYMFFFFFWSCYVSRPPHSSVTAHRPVLRCVRETPSTLRARYNTMYIYLSRTTRRVNKKKIKKQTVFFFFTYFVFTLHHNKTQTVCVHLFIAMNRFYILGYYPSMDLSFVSSDCCSFLPIRTLPRQVISRYFLFLLNILPVSHHNNIAPPPSY